MRVSDDNLNRYFTALLIKHAQQLGASLARGKAGDVAHNFVVAPFDSCRFFELYYPTPPLSRRHHRRAEDGKDEGGYLNHHRMLDWKRLLYKSFYSQHQSTEDASASGAARRKSFSSPSNIEHCWTPNQGMMDAKNS